MKPRGSRNSVPPKLSHYQVPPYAAKLTRRHRDFARADETYANHLRTQTAYPARVDALIAGRTWFEGRECARCGGRRRRVYNVGCYDCQQLGRGFQTDARGRCVALPPAKLSRDGWLARNDERRRETAGEFIEYRSGDWLARQYPTGRLSVRCLSHHIDNPDFGKLPGPRILRLCTQHPDLVVLLRQAGWSI
jgi:hypothetical protein